MVMERWQPAREVAFRSKFGELEDVERRFNEIFGRSLAPLTWKRWPTPEMGWAPAIEVFEKGNNIVIRAEVPGVKEEDIEVSLEGDTLTIKGEKKAESEVKEDNYYRCERSYGSFLRSVVLPSTIDANKIEADFEDGVIEITVPKAKEARPKKVEVKAKKKATAKE